MPKGTVIFDGDCPFCRMFSQLARWFGFEVRSIQESQEFLKSMLGQNFPFALYLIVEHDDVVEVAWGKEAIVSMLKILRFGPMSYLGYVIYPVLKKVNTKSDRINRERGICGCMLSGRKFVRK